MADSFINNLEESSTVKLTDYTVFDIVNNDSGQYFTKKITLKTLSENLTGAIVNTVQSKIDTLQASLNTVSTEISNKLDKRGLPYGSTNKMSGTLLVNTQLSVTDVSHFSNNLNVHNNKIVNLNDPTDDYDAVNKKYVTTKIGELSIPNTANFLVKSGDTMTGGNLTLFNEPQDAKHATTKYYVDTSLSAVSATILNKTNLSAYIPLSGGIMTGGYITAASDYPTDDRHLSTKKYIVDKFVPLDPRVTGKNTILAPLYFDSDFTTGATNNLIFSTKKYVDEKVSGVPSNYLPLAGGTLTGPLIIKSFSEKVASATAAATTIIDLNLGNTFTIDLTANITAFTFNNVPTDSFSVTLIITQNKIPAATITNWTINSIPIKWENGNKPVISTASNAIDLIVITKVGSNYYGFNGGQNFS